ncbi:uncharacterized protein LOC131314020 [Rhododendron vialii]|uniref:uncharacterized protein LOC131314020 n=1 Tax=Rhododendron vialii TaxID=182163 RepID=UPI00265E86CF|nr:uncharacterized protein LOC131314020 [Rhododendron vialii]
MGFGPAFNGDFPESLYPFYPLAKEALPFDFITTDWTAYPKDIPNRLWHKPDKQYVQWVNLMAAVKEGLWKEVGIYEALMLNCHLIDMDKALCSFFTGLRPHEVRADCFVSQKTPSFIYLKSAQLAYSNFLKCFAGEKGEEVIEEEHVALFIYWLNKCIFCVSSSRITKEFTDIAKALASGQKLALAPLVLAHLYRGMQELLTNKFAFAPGLIWIVTLWLWSYFPTLAPKMNKNPTHACYGRHYMGQELQLRDFNSCFTYFYLELTTLGKGYMPFEREIVPLWLKNPAGEPGEDFDEHKEVWASFFILRDLLYGMGMSSANNRCGTEYYNAAQFARQFGLMQLIPIPPYLSCNKDFIDRVIVPEKTVETIRNQFAKDEATFQLRPYLERPEKSLRFEKWWAAYVNKYFDKDLDEVLAKITPVAIIVKDVDLVKKKTSRSKGPSPSASLKRKGAQEVIKPKPVGTPQKKRLKKLSDKRPTTEKTAAIAGRTRSSTKTSSPEQVNLSAKPTSEGSRINLEHEASSRTPEKSKASPINLDPTPIQKEEIVEEAADEDIEDFFKTAASLVQVSLSGIS